MRIIDYRQGDLFKHPFSEQSTYVVHVANDRGSWGAGFVLPLAKHIPLAKSRYLAWAAGNANANASSVVPYSDLRMGCTQFVNAGDEAVAKLAGANRQITVCNMVAQTLGGKRPLRYDKLIECMQTVKRCLKQYDPNARIVAPLFGSDLAGGNWNFVADLIEDIWLRDFPVTVYWMPSRYPAEFNPPELPPRFLVRSDDSVVWEYQGDWGVYDIKDKPLTIDGKKSLPNEHHTYETLINTNKDGVTFFPIQEDQIEEYNAKRDEFYKQLSEDARKKIGCGDEGEPC
jgi:hypothetical protein